VCVADHGGSYGPARAFADHRGTRRRTIKGPGSSRAAGAFGVP